LAQVAFLLPNTTETIVAMLASLKARKAYVPLDHNFPTERLRAMLEDAEPALLLTDDQHMRLAEELAGKQMRILNMSRIERHPDAPGVYWISCKWPKIEDNRPWPLPTKC